MKAFKVPALINGQDIRKVVEKSFQEFEEYRCPSGGLSLWKGQDKPYPYATVYCMFAFALAEQNGYALNQKMISDGKRYLKSLLRAEEAEGDLSHGISTTLSTKCFALYVLSLWGEKDPAYLHLLLEKEERLPLFARCMLLKTLHSYGDDPEREKLMTGKLLNKIKVSSTTAHFEEENDKSLEWCYSSNLRTTAIILQTLVEMDKDIPQATQIVKWIVDARKAGGWRTTQENFYVFHALSAYFNKYEKEEPDFRGTILIESSQIISEMFQGRDMTMQRKTIPLKKVTQGQKLPLTIKKTGTGRLYYGIRMVYAPKYEVVKPRDEGLTVFKSIRPLSGGRQSEDFKAGSLYLVTLTVVTPQERTFVVVNDPIPAGLEVVDTSFETESRELAEKLSNIRNSEQRWWGTFNHFENYDDCVLLFADELDTGEHTFTYIVKAFYPGTYLLPPTKAEQMYQPEIFGNTSQKIISVK